MGTLAASVVLSRASALLIDPSYTRWPATELLLWLSDAQREAVFTKPTSNNVVASRSLAAGTRQTLPSDGHVLLDIKRNTGGGAIRIVTRELLDDLVPNWHTATATSAVDSYVYDLQDQTAFYVYPPNDGTGSVEINYAKIPAEITQTNQLLEVSDVLLPALVSYVMSRAYCKEGETASPTLATAYYQQFQAMLAAKDTAEAQASVNWRLTPVNPENRSTAS